MAQRARGALAMLIAGSLAGYLTSVGATPAVAGEGAPVRLLQLNLCDSGFASCFTGRSTAEAAAVIRAQAPDLVTLNEICQDDVATLGRVLGERLPGQAVAAEFQPAFDARIAAPMRCRDGQRYGIGVLSRWPLAPGPAVDEGVYPVQLQDRRNPEGRAWLCLDTAAGPALTVCTTHLASSSRAVAAAQCAYLFGTVVARLQARAGAPVVVGADLNLAAADGPWSCTPSTFARVDDDGLQHVVGTPGLAVTGRRTIELHGATDHPGLLVTLAARSRPSAGQPAASRPAAAPVALHTGG